MIDLSHSALSWLLVGVAAVGVLAAACVRVVPEHQRFVVTRWGKTVRVVGPGVVWRLAWLERLTPVSLRPHHQVLGIAASTVDGVSVHVRVTAQFHVTDPGRSVAAVDDAVTATCVEVECAVARSIGTIMFGEVLAARHRLESDLPALVSGPASAWGVQVTAVDIGDIEVMLTAEVLHSLHRLGAE